MKKEWKKKASFEYRIPNIFCTFKLFIGNKYKILLPTPVFIICTSNNGNIYTKYSSVSQYFPKFKLN